MQKEFEAAIVVARADAHARAVIVEGDERRQHEIERARIYVDFRLGLEDAEDICADLDQVL